MSEEKIETYDEVKKVGIASGKPPETRFVGPRRKPPAYYAGETFGTRKAIDAITKRRVRVRREINYPDVERNADGSVPGIRNKLMRRVIRGALKRWFSKFERSRILGREMLKQAHQIAREEGKSKRWAKRLFERELAIHQARPNNPTRQERRAYKRALAKANKKDAISQLVDKMVAGEL